MMLNKIGDCVSCWSQKALKSIVSCVRSGHNMYGGQEFFCVRKIDNKYLSSTLTASNPNAGFFIDHQQVMPDDINYNNTGIF